MRIPPVAGLSFKDQRMLTCQRSFVTAWFALRAKSWHPAPGRAFRLSHKDSRPLLLSFYSLWRGDSLICAGLASRLAWQIAHHTVLHRLNHPDQPPSAKAATEELLAMLAHAVEQGYAQTAWVSGMARLLEHAMRAAAHEARLR